MWVARDKRGYLEIFSKKPHRDKIYGRRSAYDTDRCPIMEGFLILANIRNPKWEDEPIEVNITPVPSRKEKMADSVNEKFIKAYAEYYDYVSHKQDIRGYSEEKEKNCTTKACGDIRTWRT